VLITFEDGSGQKSYPFNDFSQKSVSTIEDLLRGNFMQTCSVMFRRDLFGPPPDWFFELKLGDWPLHVLNAQYGWVGYIDEVMASYRVHGDGVWSTTDMAYRVRAAVQAFEALDQHLDPKYRPQIKTSLASAKFELWRLENVGGSKREDRTAALEYLRAAMAQRPRDVRGIVRVLGHTYAPRLMPRMVKMYKSLRRL